jgi:hypothetical protein
MRRDRAAQLRSPPSLALAAALALGCASAPEAGEQGDGDSAGASTKPGARTPKTREAPARRRAGRSSTGEPAPTVAVVNLDADESRPCEALCGRAGDCLSDDDAHGSAAASSLELSCLDLCVHAPRDDPARTAFLACDERSSCGELTSCLEAAWLPISLARKGPEVAAVGMQEDRCRAACRWIYYCSAGTGPPGEGTIDPSYQPIIELCYQDCDNASVDRSRFNAIYECLVDNCSQDKAYDCLRRAAGGRQQP